MGVKPNTTNNAAIDEANLSTFSMESTQEEYEAESDITVDDSLKEAEKEAEKAKKTQKKRWFWPI